MRLVSVVGTRPQLIKAAALGPALRARHDEVFVDTGQHWDETLAGTFFAELGLPRPDHSLGAGGGSDVAQLAAMLSALEPVLRDVQPDAVLVYGDTNSTLAGALAAAKLGLPVAHVEAGLRSFDRRMPEELNRILADHLSRWLFAPTEAAVDNLRREGIERGVSQVGDVMQDLVARMVPEVRDPASIVGVAYGLAPGGYLFATIHRAENRERQALAAALGVLDRLATPARPVILALHPGTRRAAEAAGVRPGRDVIVVDPQGYRTSLGLQLHAAAVITDSGGIQREAAWLGTPCLVLRESTEWLETITGEAAQSVLVGRDPDRAQEALARLAPESSSASAAIDRASRLNVAPAGAGEAISAALAA